MVSLWKRKLIARAVINVSADLLVKRALLGLTGTRVHAEAATTTWLSMRRRMRFCHDSHARAVLCRTCRVRLRAFHVTGEDHFRPAGLERRTYAVVIVAMEILVKLQLVPASTYFTGIQISPRQLEFPAKRLLAHSPG